MNSSTNKKPSAASIAEPKIITKETIKRLLSDVKAILKSPLTENGIYYIHDDTDIMKGYAMIVGPEDTPYFGGFYFFKISYPRDYPHTPPRVTYHTNGDNIRFNPNLYKCGKVCVSLLNTWRGEQWTSCQTISTMLLTLCTLLCKNPLLNEPGVSITHQDFDKYTKIIEYKNVELAMLAMLNKKKGVYPEDLDMFYPFLKENFEKNKEKVVAFLESKKGMNETIKTDMYSMLVAIDYEGLLKKVQQYKLNL
jgi:ubiquitin-conjugating enzyme E2 Z